MFGIKLGNVDGRSSILPLKQEQNSLAESRYSVSKYSAGRRRSSRIKTASDWDFGDRPTIQSDATKTLYRPPPKNKKKTTIFSSLFCLSKRLVLCYSSQCTFYIVFLRSPHRCVVSLLPRRLHHSVYTPLFSGSSYRSVFVLLLTNFIRCDHFFIAAISINIF